MAGLKHVRYVAAFPENGSCKLRGFQQTVRKGFLLGRMLIPKHAGYKADRRVDQALCGDLSAGQDKVPKRHLFDPEMVQNALIDTLEPAAKKGDAIGL